MFSQVSVCPQEVGFAACITGDMTGRSAFGGRGLFLDGGGLPLEVGSLPLEVGSLHSDAGGSLSMGVCIHGDLLPGGLPTGGLHWDTTENAVGAHSTGMLSCKKYSLVDVVDRK